jgi:uncharacterized protein (TIGR00369 family)
MSDNLAYATAILRGELEPPPVARLLGIEIIDAAPGRAVFEMEVGRQHHNPMGTLHGGIVCDIADFAMGVAYGSQLNPGESFTTVELKTNFLRPVRSGCIRAVARVVSAGVNVGLVECDVTDERGRLVARASSTCMTLRGQKADGRRVTDAVAIPAGA